MGSCGVLAFELAGGLTLLLFGDGSNRGGGGGVMQFDRVHQEVGILMMTLACQLEIVESLGNLPGSVTSMAVTL